MICIDRYVDTNKLLFVGQLCSEIVKGMLAKNQVHLYTKESFCFRHNGLYDLLDQLCEYWGWTSDQFVLSTPNIAEKHHKYQIKYVEYLYDGLTQTHLPPPNNTMIQQLRLIKPVAWDGSYDYGLFIGRANATRLRAIELHHKFKYRHRGLSSFLSDLEQYVDPASLLEYLCESNRRWSEIKAIRPYSDIGDVLPVPVKPPQHILGWQNVYKKIAIEIVCETSEIETSKIVSEKLFRCFLYRRPFLLISGRSMLKTLREASEEVNFKTFDHVLPNGYDQDQGIARVDSVYDILKHLIKTGAINTLQERCQDDLEHNYQNVMKYLENQAAKIKYNHGPIGTSIDLALINKTLDWQSKTLSQT